LAQTQAHGLADRIRIEAGSFSESVPSGGDAYILAGNSEGAASFSDAAASQLAEIYSSLPTSWK
jgi:hypothetical protein